MDRAEHWDEIYATRGEQGVSWFEPEPATSMGFVRRAIEGGTRSAVDVGGGASRLVDLLIQEPLDRVAVLDVSETAEEIARARLGPRAGRVHWIVGDATRLSDIGPFDMWHDRAVFHFLVSPADRAAYLATMRAALPSGAVILAAFAANGPEYCSGLPVARYDPAGLAAELTAAYGDAVTITGHHAEQHRTQAGAIQPFTWLTARLS